MSNTEIATLLNHVAAAMRIIDERKYYFQIVAYEKAADSLLQTHIQAVDLLREGKLEELPGIGESIRSHIAQLLRDGKVPHFEGFLSHVPASIFPLLDVPGIGPKKAFKIVHFCKLLNPDTVIDDVVQAAKEGKIATIPSFGEKSQQDIIRAVSEYKARSGKLTRTLLPMADRIASDVIHYLKKHRSVQDVRPLGSLRRKMPTVGDIDIAVASSDARGVISHFILYPNIKRVIEQGDATASIITSSGSQVDLMVQPLEAFGSLLQHFTGSKYHNVHLREIALEKGMSMSEYGIKHKGQLHKLAREEDVYKMLGMDWIPPELREDKGEIEAAMAHRLPSLIEVRDIKGDFHIHSNYPIEPSHDLGNHSMEDHLKKAISLGYEYIAFSEHNPSISQHSKDDIITIMKKRNAYIEQLKSNTKNIHIFSMCEIDILANGDLALPEEALELLDGAIVSIHSNLDDDQAAMTKRVLKGLSHPKAKVLAHPTGRLLGKREGYQLEWREIFDFMIEHHKAIEINAWPERTDAPDSVIREGIEKGVKFVINTDSHALEHMDLMPYGVDNARRGWATKDAIINAMRYTSVAQWFTQ
jgi:DNA polymerase (family 10)